MAFKETQIWDCPFCGKNTIVVDYFPRTLRPYKTSWGGSKPGWKKSVEQIVLRVEECTNCKKTSIDIERKFHEEGVI